MKIPFGIESLGFDPVSQNQTEKIVDLAVGLKMSDFHVFLLL